MCVIKFKQPNEQAEWEAHMARLERERSYASWEVRVGTTLIIAVGGASALLAWAAELPGTHMYTAACIGAGVALVGLTLRDVLRQRRQRKEEETR
jgi:hypothetical protein